MDSDIIITNELGENIGKQLKEEIVSKIVTNEKVDLSALNIMKQKLQKHIAYLQLQLKQATTEEEKREIRRKIETATLAMYFIDSEKMKNIRIKGTNESQIKVDLNGQYITIQEILEQINDFKAPKVNINDLPKKQRAEITETMSAIMGKVKTNIDLDDGNGLENSKYRMPIIRMIKEKLNEEIKAMEAIEAKDSNFDTEEKDETNSLLYMLQQELMRQRQERIHKKDIENEEGEKTEESKSKDSNVDIEEKDETNSLLYMLQQELIKQRQERIHKKDIENLQAENISKIEQQELSRDKEEKRQELQERKNTALILSYILQQELSKQRDERLYHRDMKNAVDEVLGKDDKESKKMKESIDKDGNLGLTEKVIKGLKKKLDTKKQELSNENTESLTPKQQKELQRRKNSTALFEYLLEREKLRLSNKIENTVEMQQNSTVKDVLKQINQGSKVSVNINRLETVQKVELKQAFDEFISDENNSDEIITGNITAAIRRSLDENGTLGIAQNIYINNNDEVISTFQGRMEQTINNLQEQEKNAKTDEERIEIEKKKNAAQLFNYMLKQERDKVFEEKLTNRNETIEGVLEQIKEGNASNININDLKKEERKRVEDVLSKTSSNNLDKNTSISTLDDVIENVNSQIKELEESQMSAKTQDEVKEIASKKKAAILARYLVEKQRDEKLSEEGVDKKVITSTKDILEQIKAGEQTTIDIDNIREKNEVKQLLTGLVDNEVINNTVVNMSAEDLTQSLKKSLDRDGSIKKSEVPSGFSKIAEEAKKLRQLSEKIQEMGNIGINKNGQFEGTDDGPIIYSKEDLLDMVRGAIRTKNSRG